MPSPRYWREIPTRYRLEAGRCRGCGRVVYPARRICPSCRGTDFEAVKLSHRGTVVTSTVIHVAPSDFTIGGTCVEWDDGIDTQAVDSGPVPATIYYYLVAAEDSCGRGTAGNESGGTERQITACP